MTILQKNIEHPKKSELVYQEAGIAVKREIVGAIFPEKLEYENGNYRTPRLNEGVELIV